jgi:hypothetical protein
MNHLITGMARGSLFLLASSKLFSRLAVHRASAFTLITPSPVTTEESCRYHALFCSRSFLTSSDFHDFDNLSHNDERRGSVTGLIYSDESSSSEAVVTVKLFTKQGCTLCDKVREVLESVRLEQPHTLEAVDISDPDQIDWNQRYKYDIPILHINGMYWAKHRLRREQAIAGLEAARVGSFVEARPGEEPDAGAMERRQAERMAESEIS